jgi:hypothetical protein
MRVDEFLTFHVPRAEYRPQGECTLVEAVDAIRDTIERCRERGVNALLVVGTGLTGVAMPTLVDRFLMIEEWAHEARGMVVVALVAHAEYIHPEKFGVKVAADLGLTIDVFTDEDAAIAWLARASGRSGE